MTGRERETVTGRERVRRLGLRWVHLLQGGALLTPFFLLVMVGLGIAWPGEATAFGQSYGWQFAGFGLALPLAAVAGLLPSLRTLETASVRALCGVRAGALATGPARTWAARRRSAAWFTLHAGLGALVSGASLATPPMALVLLAFPFVPGLRERDWNWPWDHEGAALWAAPVAGFALLAGLLALVYGAGALLARCAPALLGPTPADRLAAAERRAADLAARNRLARELHDSVGHALSAVSLQASAARRVLETDAGFVREALASIEETSRGAVAELDAVLGVLREDQDARSEDDGHSTAPTLATGLEGLLARTRATGTEVDVTVDAALEPLALLGVEMSAAAFRVLQEGLSNALRHAPGVPVHVRLERHRSPERELLILFMENRMADADPPPRRPSGGRGLAGLAERAALLDGVAHAGAEDGVWRLTARLPLETRTTRPESTS
ncbi:histidine kinase [Streptomyces sp. NBC_01775]|uniref:sensor histidine kinase n=1 Tax=Streptomyces sp. NBC_01775 TaxID=2975939 RepID=UPI002DD9B810|nr:histidine kinase [Streptomyces sp. NBC_01775]WSB80059.1 histidine kinase [Streptomyces sp. NBC_01775]